MALYLVTGIAGFIGSSLARALLARGEQVRGVDNFATGNHDNAKEILGHIDFRKADVLDLNAMHNACKGVDFVLHHAAIPSVPKSIVDPLGSNQSNIDGTVNVLIAARDAKVKRVVYAASSAAYGDEPTLPKHEQMKPDPISPPMPLVSQPASITWSRFTAATSLKPSASAISTSLGPDKIPRRPTPGSSPSL